MMELLGTVVSSPVLRKVGTIMLWNGLERMAVMNHKLDQMLFICTGAKSGNVKVFKWALWNEYFDENYWSHYIFIDIAENRHIKILKIADRKEVLDWYSREILVGAAARNHWELLDFLLEKEPNQFNLSFIKMCVREGFIKVMDWWKSVELIELIKEAACSGQWRMLDNLYNNEYQQACSDLKQFLN
jgi:hypothetical protein